MGSQFIMILLSATAANIQHAILDEIKQLFFIVLSQGARNFNC